MNPHLAALEARATQRARTYPALLELRAEATKRRAMMARVISAEPDGDPYRTAAELERRAQALRHDAAEKAAEALAALAESGGLSIGAYDAAAWHAVRRRALELTAAADAVAALEPDYRAACDSMNGCGTPYAHNEAHNA